MEIFAIIDSLNVGGAQRQFIMIVNELAKRHRVVVFVIHPIYNLEHSLSTCKSIEIVKLFPRNYISSFLFINRRIGVRRPDLLFSFMHGPNILSALIKIVNPWLLVKVSERSGFRQLIFRDFLRMFLYLFVDSVLFNSYKSKDFITNKFYWLRKKSNIIYNVIDGQLFSFFDNRDFSKHSICVVANYRPEKNVDLLIDFLHTYVSKRETCFITWYGNNFYVNGRPSPSSKCYQTAIGKIRSLELSKNLKLYPLVEKPVEVYRKNNALLLLSSFEGFPNVVGEAMMSGCVILVSPVSDVDLIIEHRKTGFIFRDFTIEALEEGFEWYFSLTSEDLIIAGELNRLKAEKLFTTENINRLL